jgi:hypothetical protein
MSHSCLATLILWVIPVCVCVTHAHMHVTTHLPCVCVYYCSTYYKAVREGGREMEDMCYEKDGYGHRLVFVSVRTNKRHHHHRDYEPRPM